MNQTEHTPTPPVTGQLQQGFLLLIVVVISVLFVVMVRNFVVTVILAGVFASMSRPVFLALSRRLGNRKRVAASATLLGLVLLVGIPLAGFFALVVSQAGNLSEVAGPWLSEQITRLPEINARLGQLPVIGQFLPSGETIAASASDFASSAGSLLVSQIGAATSGTVNGVLQLFVMLYAMYFFLLDGPRILARILYYAPLNQTDEDKLVGQFVSVTRATIKGSILVGLIQGGLAGAAFFVLDLPAAAFWATVMAILSVIPVLGSGLVWLPASVILMSTGRVAEGIGLMLWGVVIVSTVDNFLRPRLIGRDTKMHDLMVLLSTFGGLALFGVVGFIVGPIVAALFVTVWALYGAAFSDFLPEPSEALGSPDTGESDSCT